MKRETWLKIISGLIASMFFYAALIKLLDYETAKREMLNQLFPQYISITLTWLLPIVEIILVFLLVYTPTRFKALWASFGLLSAFTVYISIALTGVFGYIPCSCAGILNSVSYGPQIIFNIFFMVLALIGISIQKEWTINFFGNNKRKELYG